jgi:hypothetical protein
MNEGVNITPRGQISPLGARGEVKNGPLHLHFLRTSLRGSGQELSPDFPVLDFDGSLGAAVHEEHVDRGLGGPRRGHLLDKEVSDGRAHEEVEVGKDGHEKEGAAEETVQTADALRAEKGLLKKGKKRFKLDLLGFFSYFGHFAHLLLMHKHSCNCIKRLPPK